MFHHFSSQEDELQKKLQERKQHETAGTGFIVTKTTNNPTSTISKEPPKVPDKPNFFIPRKTSGQALVHGLASKRGPSDFHEVSQRKPPPITFKKDPVPLPTKPVKQPMQNLRSNFEPKGVSSVNSFQQPVKIPEEADSGSIPGETAFQRAQRLAKENAKSNSVSLIFKILLIVQIRGL